VVHLGYFFSNAEGSYDGAGPARGMSFQLGIDLAERGTGSDFSLRSFEASLTGYVPMPWKGNHSLALRTSGAVSGGSYPSGTYYVGGYDLENISVFDTITTGVFNSNFVLRGYNPGTYAGRAYLLQTFEYRLPLLKPDLGYSTLPLYLQRIDGAVFLDYGGAFDDMRARDIKLFHDGELIDAPGLHAGAGAELWFGVSFGYVLYAQLRLGYAYGFSAEAIENGQIYFVASSTF
jgi:outer membrane protein assembly factor BamA